MIHLVNSASQCRSRGSRGALGLAREPYPERLWLRALTRQRAAAAVQRKTASERPRRSEARSPSHVALITDHELRPRTEDNGHSTKRCLRALLSSVLAARLAGIRYLTLSTFGPVRGGIAERAEPSALSAMLQDFIVAGQSRFVAAGIRVTTIGSVDELPTSLRRALEGLCEATRQGSALTLTLAVAYTGRADIVDAARSLAALIRAGLLLPEEVDEQSLRAQLVTHALPPVDLSILTAAADGRDFLPFASTNSKQISVAPALANFRSKHLCAALELYDRSQDGMGQRQQHCE